MKVGNYGRGKNGRNCSLERRINYEFSRLEDLVEEICEIVVEGRLNHCCFESLVWKDGVRGKTRDRKQSNVLCRTGTVLIMVRRYQCSMKWRAMS